MTVRPPLPRRLIFLWVGAALLLAIALALAVRQEQVHGNMALKDAEAESAVLADSVGAALAFDDADAMSQYLEALMRNPQVAAAGIYDANGRPLAELVRPGAAPLPATLAGPLTEREHGRILVARMASEHGQKLGFVFLETAPETLADLIGRHMGLIILAQLALLLLTFITGAASRLEYANTRLGQEIVARNAAEEALRQSQKLEALGQLTGGIAHDFNNLLQAIHGAFELILGRAGDEATVRRWALNGLEASDRGASLTRQLLAFSRQQKLELKPLMVTDVLNGMRDLMARTLGPKIELVFQLSADRVWVMSDPTQLELAVMNLAVNARDAMPDGGRLTVRTRPVDIDGDALLASGRYLQLQVIDTGQGMSLSVLRRAFDPFFTTKAQGKGTGLGLAQVYGVARQAGGDARIASSPGGGTTVTVLLRQAPRAGETAIRRPAVAQASLLPALTVLVVDDDDQVRTVVRGGLEVRGFTVLEASSGPAALAVAGETPPQVAVIDYAMPGMDGAQTAERLRRMIPQLPIILASGHSDTAAVERALGGEATVLRKPFDLNQLSEAVAAVASAA
jgi:signal transduction histidine kinase